LYSTLNAFDSAMVVMNGRLDSVLSWTFVVRNMYNLIRLHRKDASAFPQREKMAYSFNAEARIEDLSSLCLGQLSAAYSSSTIEVHCG